MRINRNMAELLKQRPVKVSRELPADLEYIAKAGWKVGPCGALLLKYRWGTPWMFMPQRGKRRRLKELWGSPWRILFYWEILWLLQALKGNRRRYRIDPSQVGSYEYDANEVYGCLDDLRAELSTYLYNAAIRGVSFAVSMLERAASLPSAESLTAVVCVFVDEHDEDFFLQGVIIRFYTLRGDYPTWFDDLERFQLHAMAVLDMRDLGGTDTLSWTIQ